MNTTAASARSVAIHLSETESLSMLYRPHSKDRFTIQEIWEKHPYRLKRHAGVERKDFIDETYARMVQEGATPLILDLGANIGASVLAFRRYYPAAKVIAVEPEAGNFDLLTQNVADAGDVACVRAAVASFDGTVALSDPGRSTDAYRTGPAAEGASIGEVPALSVSSLLAMAPDARPFLAKIDIEGAEDDLFGANTDWVDLFPAIAIELHDWMLPGRASSANFLRCVGEKRRDFINPSMTDIAFSLRNPA